MNQGKKEYQNYSRNIMWGEFQQFVSEHINKNH